MTTTDVPPLQVTPQCRRDNGFATMINMNRLRELTAELGFIPATTDGPDIDRHRQLNKNADYWLADRPDVVAARPGVRRGHGSGVPDYRRSGGRERRGRRCQLGWGSAGSGRAGARWAGCRWYGSGCGSQSGDLVPDGESAGHFGTIVVSGEPMAAGPGRK